MATVEHRNRCVRIRISIAIAAKVLDDARVRLREVFRGRTKVLRSRGAKH
jgi:hypothetical protein